MLRRLLLLALAIALPCPAQAVEKRTLCVFDPSGESGDFYQDAVPYALAALEWEVDFGHPQVRQDEKIAVEDFRAGKCDVIVMTGVRARQFVPGASTLEAVGGLQNYGQLKTAVNALARPAEARLMQNGEFESAGIFPAGAVYLFVHDGRIRDTAALAGLRIATLDYDEPSSLVVHRVGAAAVSADASTFSGMFNSGAVDVAYAPITVYRPLEFGKGIGTTGGVIRFPLAMLTWQVVFRGARMPEGFGSASRQYLAGRFDAMMKNVERCERDVPAASWIDIPNKKSYDALFQSVRMELAGRGVYDRAMLHKLLLVRCREDGTRAECAEKKE